MKRKLLIGDRARMSHTIFGSDKLYPDEYEDLTTKASAFDSTPPLTMDEMDDLYLRLRIESPRYKEAKDHRLRLFTVPRPKYDNRKGPFVRAFLEYEIGLVTFWSECTANGSGYTLSNRRRVLKRLRDLYDTSPNCISLATIAEGYRGVYRPPDIRTADPHAVVSIDDLLSRPHRDDDYFFIRPTPDLLRKWHLPPDLGDDNVPLIRVQPHEVVVIGIWPTTLLEGD